MSDKDMNCFLLPSPKHLRSLPNTAFSSEDTAIQFLSDPELPAEGYRLRVDEAGLVIASADPAGEFYGRQTFAQLKRQFPRGIPSMEIEDAPDVAVRGLYHDVTRGEVPTLDTLKELATMCAHYKLNQLQLYVEHTYAYKAFPEVWADADPLRAEEILELDAFCAERFIELVPSFSTFGHFYPFIHTPRFQHLNELERDVSGEGFNWFDRMQHYTLDCQNPESLALVETLIEEVRPLFRSSYFNICADETFDLGKGKNRDQAEDVGKGRLYIDFVQKVLGIVRKQGATPMMWGDIVATYPELASELDQDVVLLDWNYAPEPACSKHLIESRRPFYVCSGTQTWNRFLPPMREAYQNITRLNRAGIDGGCKGCLITNWGDFGHIGMLSLAYPGILMGAAASWNLTAAETDEEGLYETISRLEFGDASGRLVGLLAELASLKDPFDCLWRSLSFWLQDRSKDMPDDWFEAESGLPNMFVEIPSDTYAGLAQRLRDGRSEIAEILETAAPRDTQSLEEIRQSIDLSILLLDAAVFLHERRQEPALDSGDLCRRLEKGRALWKEQWMSRNKASEFYRIEDVMKALIHAL